MISPEPHVTRREGLVLGFAVLVILIGKLWTVAVYAPLILGDNGGFLQGADEILAGPEWMSDARLEEQIIPNTLWRPIGYTLLIAAMKSVFPDNWAIVLCTLQASLSLLTGLLLFRLCLAAKFGVTLSVAAFLFHQWSTPMSTDALIMQDSLIGSFGTLACMVILKPVVEGALPSIFRFLLAGFLIAICFLIREVYHFVVPVLGGATFIWIGKSAGWRNGLLSSVALAFPLFCTVFALQAWNYERTGHAVVSTAGQTGYVYALLRAAKHDPSLISGDSKFLNVIRETNKSFDYNDAHVINGRLFRVYGMNSVEQSIIARDVYWRSLVSKPKPFVLAALERLRLMQQATLFAGPITRVDDLDWWAGLTPEKHEYARGIEPDNKGYRKGWRDDAANFLKSFNFADLTFETLLHGGFRLLVRIFGGVAFAIFIIGTPFFWFYTRKSDQGVANAALIGWGLYCLWICLYVPVSFEVRYLSPVIASSFFALAAVFAHLFHSTNLFRSRTYRSAY